MSFTGSAQAPASQASEALQRVFVKSLRDHWLLLLFEGIALIALGTVAVVVPAVTSLAVEIFIGWLFLAIGAVGLTMTIFGRKLPGLPWSLLSAIMAIVTGGLLVWWPLSGVVTLTLLVAAYFIFDGISSIMLALDHRANSARSWVWLLASALLDLICAGIIITGLPGTATWVIGLLVGIDMVFGGMAMVASAVMARASTDPATA